MRKHFTLPIHEHCELGHYIHNKAEDSLAEHLHQDAIEICFLIKGRQTYHGAGQTVHMKGGEYFLTQPNQLHHSAGQPQDKGELIWFILEIPTMNHSFLNLPKEEGRALRQALLGIDNPYFKGGANSKHLWKRLVKSYEHSAENALQQLIDRHWLVACLLDVIECAGSNRLSIADESMDACRQRIAADPAAIKSLDELATSLHMSTSHFKARFKQSTGMPPGEYINRKKVELAKQLLLKNISLTRLAHQLHYCSSQYFATVFKRYTRLTPSEWRQIRQKEG